MNNIFRYLQNNKYTPWVAFVVLGLISTLSTCQTEDSPILSVKKESQEIIKSVDTYIPRGHVLVPLDLQNAESLTGIVSDIGGVVDIYTVSSEIGKSKKVATKVKILKAPLNPQQFAILLSESESTLFLNNSGPFIAVIQNPQEKTPESHKQSAVPQIQYLGD